jgi:hypothetical protein
MKPWNSTRDGGAAKRRACDVNRCIIEDGEEDDPPVFSTTSQKVMATVILHRAMPEPSTPKRIRVHQGLRGLLEQAVVQNTESSVSQHHDSWARRSGEQPPPKRAPSVQGPTPPNPWWAPRHHSRGQCGRQSHP